MPLKSSFGSIAVLGTGAIGSSIAADLVREGHDVTLVDQWPAHVEAMRAQGLTLAFRDADTFDVPVRVADGSHTLQIKLTSIDGKIVNFGIPVLVVGELPKSST